MSESQSTSDYPGALDTWETLTDKEDLAEVIDINKIKAALLAIQTELGINPAGSLATVLARLAMIQNIDGAIQKGTSFPVSGLVDGQIFYRTDQNVLYVYNGSTWDSQGQSLSNVIFSWAGSFTTQGSNSGLYVGTDISPSTFTADYMFFGIVDTNYAQMLSSKYTKLPGQTTITIFANLWNDHSGNTAHCLVDIGGQTGEVSRATATTPGWATSSTVDVSGLDDGTTYDIAISIKRTGTNSVTSSLGSVILIAS
jgi:hypothetical protein